MLREAREKAIEVRKMFPSLHFALLLARYRNIQLFSFDDKVFSAQLIGPETLLLINEDAFTKAQ